MNLRSWAGIVIVAGLGPFALDDFKSLWRIRRSEFWLGTITVVAVLVLRMLGGIAFAIGLSLLVAVARVVRPHTAELFFANAAFLVRDVIERIVESDPPATALVLGMEGVSDIDTTAIQQFDELLDDLDAADVTVTMARVRRPVREMLERSDVLDRVSEDGISLEVDDAVEKYRGSAG